MMSDRQVLIVLGMHRSGTSVVACAMQTLGFSLGETLLPPVLGDNDKGYFEDAEITALNMEMLAYLKRDWYTIKPITNPEIETLLRAGFLEQAVQLLKTKLAERGLFAFKDPRIIQLLEIWTNALDQLAITPRFVLAVRHPLSVIRSLETVRRMDPDSGIMLWLVNVIESLIKTQGTCRHVISYDELMVSPHRVLDLAGLRLGFLAKQEAIDGFAEQFLEKSLQHSVHSREDLHKSLPEWPLVLDLYDLLLKASSSESTDESLSVEVEKLLPAYRSLVPAFSAADHLRRTLTLFSHELDAKNRQLERSDQLLQQHSDALSERSEQISDLNDQLSAANLEITVKTSELGLFETQLRKLQTSEQQLKQQLTDLETQIRQAAHRITVSEETLQRMGVGHKRVKTTFFDSALYLKTHPDLVTHGVNPVLHYAFHGIFENRLAVGRGSFLSRISKGIAERGGASKTTLKAIRKFRKEGLAGVKRAVAMVRARDDGAPDRVNYGAWVLQFDTLDRDRCLAIRKRVEGFSKKPLMSVVMPTYNPNRKWLVEAIESVREQIYSNWEFCIADDASTDAEIAKILKRYESKDARIKVVYRKENGHISRATNDALSLVKGEWVVLLDHDDTIPKHALACVVEAINTHPNVKMIYSDEDKIDERGQRFNPYFKPDWNPELFHSHNMFSHLGVYSARLIQEVGGFRVGFEGAQDYDLALRCTEHVDSSEIYHIPRVLYHWRVHEDSTASTADAKPYAMLAGERALNEHFQRLGIEAIVDYIRFGYHVSYALPKAPPQVTVIIPTRNGGQVLEKCIDGLIFKTDYDPLEILVIDNGSDDPRTLNRLQEWETSGLIRVFRDDAPFNYSRLNNTAVGMAKGQVVALLNDDVEVISSGWLKEMVGYALRPDIGAVGARLWYPDDTLQHGGVILGAGGIANHAHTRIPRGSNGYFSRATLPQSFSAVTAACLVVRKALYLEVGGLNEEELSVGFNDIDFCLRLKEAGYRNVWTPKADLYHHESYSRGYELTPEKIDRLNAESEYMLSRWGGIIAEDPAYNPNLSLSSANFDYAWPPRLEPLGFPLSEAGEDSISLGVKEV